MIPKIPRGGGGGGCDLVSLIPVCVCPKVEWVLFQLQGNEMNEKISFKMDANFAASFYMGKNVFDIWHVFVC